MFWKNRDSPHPRHKPQPHKHLRHILARLRYASYARNLLSQSRCRACIFQHDHGRDLRSNLNRASTSSVDTPPRARKEYFAWLRDNQYFSLTCRLAMPRQPLKLSKVNEQPFRLVPSDSGVHMFGGRCTFSGIVPRNSDVPIQQVLLLDLGDPGIPFRSEPPTRYLPLLYPFKYGMGGPEIQYSIVSNSEIEILYLSDPVPDEAQQQYLQVSELPEQPLVLRPLSYEEARCLTFMREDGHFQPNASDLALLNQLDVNNLIGVGGRRSRISNAPDIYCRNPACEFHNKRTRFQFVAAVPPIPVIGSDEFWYEFQGGHVDFCFGFCYSCGTVIAFNVAG